MLDFGELRKSFLWSYANRFWHYANHFGSYTSLSVFDWHKHRPHWQKKRLQNVWVVTRWTDLLIGFNWVQNVPSGQIKVKNMYNRESIYIIWELQQRVSFMLIYALLYITNKKPRVIICKHLCFSSYTTTCNMELSRWNRYLPCLALTPKVTFKTIHKNSWPAYLKRTILLSLSLFHSNSCAWEKQWEQWKPNFIISLSLCYIN